MRKFYAGNREQNIAEAKAARDLNGQVLGPSEQATYEGRPCTERWWLDKVTGERVQLALRKFD